MTFSPHLLPPLFSSLERDGRRNETGLPMEEENKQRWGYVGLSSEGSLGSEKNGPSEDHEGLEHESFQAKLCARGHWRPAEDTKLRELVAQYGPQNWNLIAEKLEGRSGKSCRLRWFNQLDPRINKKSFTEEEEERLLSAHRLYGNKWALIARLFPGRTDNAVKNHWHVIMARRLREQSNAYRRRKPSNSISTPSTKAFDSRMEVNGSKNACSVESTISSNRDETLSTCTGLSLHCSSNRRFHGHGFLHCSPHRSFLGPGFLTRYCPPQEQFECIIGSDEKVVAGRNGCYERLFYSGSAFHHVSPLVVVAGADHSGYSDSNSEASAAESVVNHMSNALIPEEADHEREKISLPFIDFLGVGAT